MESTSKILSNQLKIKELTSILTSIGVPCRNQITQPCFK